jgi:hypothetical protein
MILMTTSAEMIAEAEKLLEAAEAVPVAATVVPATDTVTREEFEALLARIDDFNARTGYTL